MPAVSIEIDDVAKYGVIHDSPPHEIPPEAWTLAENMRFNNASVARINGEFPIFGTPPIAPYGLQFISTVGQPWWIILGLNKAYVYDGSVYTNITRQSAGSDVNYAALDASYWNTTILGGIPIQNDGVDIPQYWPTLSSVTKLANLPNWDPAVRAKVVRAFGPYLMLLNLTISGVNKPHNVRWSDAADPGFVPGSYDITDETLNAGEVTLPDVDSGLIVDGLPLQGKFYVYKENSCWRFRNIGGQFIFDEDPFLENIGLLAVRCVAITGDGQRQFFVSNDNMYTHDGNAATPLLDAKTRLSVFNQLDIGHYTLSFVMINAVKNEAWFCYPSIGSSVCNRALIVNYNTGACTESDVDFQAWQIGTIQTGNVSMWNTQTQS